MFDAVSSLGWFFSGLVLLIGSAVGTGLLIRNAREQRYLAVADSNPTSEK